jgi:uncharacterized membrane protein
VPDPKLIVGYLPIALPLITILLVIPLVLQKVPPNLWYGFRTRKTLSDTDTWYRANYLGGAGLLFSAIVALVVNVIISMILDSAVTLPVEIGVVVISSVVALAIWSAQVRKL